MAGPNKNFRFASLAHQNVLHDQGLKYYIPYIRCLIDKFSTYNLKIDHLYCLN